VLRVVELELDPLSTPRPKEDLRVSLREATWTDEALLDLLGRYELYANLRADPRAALESFRRDTDLDVYENDFAQERSASAPPRSARIVVRFRAADPDKAVAVTRALGGLIVDYEMNSLTHHADRAEAGGFSLSRSPGAPGGARHHDRVPREARKTDPRIRAARSLTRLRRRSG
jgi:hypothetical protein